MPQLSWIDTRPVSSTRRSSSASTRPAIEGYERLLGQLQPKRILELGVFDGGSAALMALLAEPERLVVVDLEKDPAPVLGDFIEHHGMQDIVRCPSI